MMLVDEQLQEHVAGLASTPGTTDIRHLFDAIQTAGAYVIFDGHICNLKTLTDDIFFRSFTHNH